MFQPSLALVNLVLLEVQCIYKGAIISEITRDHSGHHKQPITFEQS